MVHNNKRHEARQTFWKIEKTRPAFNNVKPKEKSFVFNKAQFRTGSASGKVAKCASGFLVVCKWLYCSVLVVLL